MLHKEILSPEQIELLPFLKKFKNSFGLAGGTAVALQIGHRRSIDFDLFSHKFFKNISLERNIRMATKVDKMLVNREGEITFFTKKVKTTFFCYPFVIDYVEHLDTVIKMPSLLTLAAMKAYALGKRAKWKDYVDLYFIIKQYHSIAEIAEQGKNIFGHEFNSKIFRSQLSYFDDVNYVEAIEFMPGFAVSEKKIKKALMEFSLS